METVYLLLQLTTAFTGPILPTAHVASTHSATRFEASYTDESIADFDLSEADCFRLLDANPMALTVTDSGPILTEFVCAPEEPD